MNLLYANDRRGQYPQSWYAATAPLMERHPRLEGEQRFDVCVVGAGYTGLSAALHLAEAGYSVAVVEAQRVGFGASGRNGGQLGSGQRQDQEKLEAMVGVAQARQMWDLGEEAKDLVKGLIAKHQIDCDLRPGIAWTGFDAGETRDLHGYVDHMRSRYGYQEISALSAEEMAAICPSPAYDGGLLDMGAGHLHPLKYALGLARAALAAGAVIFEQSEVTGITEGSQPTVVTEGGSIRCDHVILGCNGYLGGLRPQVGARVMPLNNFIAATEPLRAKVRDVLREDIAVCDSKYVVNYFRLSSDGRLLFGGGESYGYRFPTDIAAKVRRPMLEIFPTLRDVAIDYAWGGTLAITMKRLPHVSRLSPQILSASGYSGHGVGTATHCGMLMARAVQGQSEGFDAMSALPTPAFPGGTRLRSPLLVLAMTWYALRDRLGI